VSQDLPGDTFVGPRFGMWRPTTASATAKRMMADGHTGKVIARYLGVSRASLYRYLTEDGAA